jgi:hypothetical protein
MWRLGKEIGLDFENRTEPDQELVFPAKKLNEAGASDFKI